MKYINKMICKYKFKIIGEKKGYIREIVIDEMEPENETIEKLKKDYDDNIYLVQPEKIKEYYRMSQDDFIKYGEKRDKYDNDVL